MTGKIAELCKYIKENLSNTIRCLLDNMKESGELDQIITDTVLSDLSLLEIKSGYFVNVRTFGIKGDGVTDETEKFEEIVSKGLDIIIPSDCHIVVNKAFELKSSIRALKGGSIKQTSKRSNILNIVSDNVVIDGLTLIGTGEGFEDSTVEGAGTLIKSSGKAVTIKNCIFKDANYVGCFIDPVAIGNMIENCQFVNCWAEGISVQSDYSKVKNCRFENCSYNGVVIRGAEHVVVDSCEFINCSITDVALDIRANYDKTKTCSDLVITNNYFKNVKICVSAYDNEPNIVHKNLLIKGNKFNGRDDSELGARFYYVENIKVTENTFEDAGKATSLLFSSCKHVICTDNILETGSLGIDCSSDEMATIKGNQVKGFSNIGIRTRTVTNTYTHNFVVAHNTLLDCATGIKTEGNYNKSIVIDANSITGSDKDLDITGAIDIFVLTNNNLNINKSISNTAQSNTFIKANNTLDKPVCSSSTRPISPTAGDMCYDTSVNKPIWYNGTKWIDATGTAV